MTDAFAEWLDELPADQERLAVRRGPAAVCDLDEFEQALARLEEETDG